MANGTRTALLALACLFAISTAFPFLFNQIVPAATDPDAPRTLLGKPYRRRRDSQGCPPSCWAISVADHDDSDASLTTLTEPRVQFPLPPVLDMFQRPVSARLRLMKAKRPLRYDDARPLLDGAKSRVKDVQHVQAPAVSRPRALSEPHEAPVRVERLERLYDRGEWKSRLLDEY